MNDDLKGMVVAVTGGFGNLGREVVLRASAHGASIALIDRATIGAPLSASLKEVLVLDSVDLESFESARRAMTEVIDRFGRLDSLVNVAGGFHWQTLEDGDPATWDRLFALNVKTAVMASKAALPHLLVRGGRIVNIGAMGAVKAAAGMGPYAASKSGVARLTEALAEEVKDRGVTVNAVLPSIIDTPKNRLDIPDADFSRWVRPQAIADVIMFLLSPQASAVTGALIPVAGKI